MARPNPETLFLNSMPTSVKNGLSIRSRALTRGMSAWLAPWLVCSGLIWGAASSQAATFQTSGGTVVGTVQAITAKHGDTLLGIAEEFELGYEEVVAANPHVDSWLPGEGSRIVLPSRFIVPNKIKKGIYINLAEYRLYYFPEGKRGTVMTFPISIGRGDWDTPVGAAQVINKVVNPAWYPPESIRREHAAEGDPLPRIVPPGPDNPLGNYALRLDLPGYLIHGTNRPYGIGMKATHGCIRLRPPNIAELFKLTSPGTPVHIAKVPFKAGVKDGVVYFEAHPDKSEVEAILEAQVVVDEEQRSAALAGAIRDVLKLVDRTGAQVDWLRLMEIAKESRGIPLPISLAHSDIEAGQVPRRSPQDATYQAENYLF